MFINLITRRNGTWFAVVYLSLISCLCLVISPTMAAANPSNQKALSLKRAKIAVLGPHLEVLEDPAGRLTIEQVTTPPLSERFIVHQRQHLSEGFSRSAYWLRFTMDFRGSPGDPLINTDKAWYLDIGRPLVFFKLRLYVPEAKKLGRDRTVIGTPMHDKEPRRVA